MHTLDYYFIANVSPTLNSRIKKIHSFDVFDRLKIYMHYFITRLSLFYNFEVVDNSKENSKNGWSNPDKVFKNIEFYYLWRDIEILSFEEFYSEENIIITDCGQDWKEKGIAQRWRIECFGVYDWYWKFESELI